MLVISKMNWISFGTNAKRWFERRIPSVNHAVFVSLQTKLESTIDAYKIKMEEMSDLRQQIKYLEETNLRLFDEKSNLEQEYKQAKLLQTQVEFHKRTNQELYQKISELQRVADKADFERTRAEERFTAINAEKLVRTLDERADLTCLALR